MKQCLQKLEKQPKKDSNMEELLFTMLDQNLMLKLRNTSKNGGFEDLKYYRNCDILFCDIDNIHEVSKCFRKIYEISDEPLNFNSMIAY